MCVVGSVVAIADCAVETKDMQIAEILCLMEPEFQRCTESEKGSMVLADQEAVARVDVVKLWGTTLMQQVEKESAKVTSTTVIASVDAAAELLRQPLPH